MGLLSRISAGFDTPAEESPQKDGGLSFFEFIKKHNLSHCAVFERVNTFFVFSHSYGFDGDTILQSISTSDFWEGTVEKEKWNYFSRDENNLNTVLQFFSVNLKTKLTYVNIFPSKDRILLVAYDTKPEYGESLDFISKDFLSLDYDKLPESVENEESKLCLYTNINEAASDVLGNLNIEIKEVMKNAFFTETYSSLKNLLEEPDSFYVSEDKKFIISIVSKSHITKESLEAFFQNALKPVFKTSSSLISYES